MIANFAERSLSLQENQYYQFKNWTFEPAYFQTDVEWSGLNFNRSNGYITSLLINIALFIISVMLVTPVSLYSIVDPIVQNIETDENLAGDENLSYMTTYLRRQLSPLMLAVVNSCIIPFLVDRSAKLQHTETKS